MESNGSDYYKYIVVYINDILHLSDNNKSDMNILIQVHILNEWSVDPPLIYTLARILKNYSCRMDVLHGQPHMLII